MKLRTRIVLLAAVAVALAVLLVSAAAFLLARRALRSEGQADEPAVHPPGGGGFGDTDLNRVEVRTREAEFPAAL